MATVEQRIKEADLSNLSDPELNEQDWEDLNQGILLFNDGEYWESHEAWEEVWKRHHENSRLFFQGLIQTAAGFHQLNRRIYHGAEKHFRNALWKLRPFEPKFLGLDVKHIVETVQRSHKLITCLGSENLDKFEQNSKPTIKRVLPS